ncbi:TRAP transporter permease [Marinimicrococcus flavescens]|uniref:TRAP transporter permease n=1 Tax=Marinimicrococcus flavescens TaxID=3031815 RepID=A0AAP3XQE7_9PROT|nr:TRAP transporter permease [Marinimicrococcus flavescens]
MHYATLARRAITVLGATMAIFHLWVAFTGALDSLVLRAAHLGFALALAYMTLPAWKRDPERGPGILDLVLLVAAVSTALYPIVELDYVYGRMIYVDDLRPADWIFGIGMIVLLLEATRRALGFALPLTALLFVGYAVFLADTDPAVLLEQLYVSTEGIFGIPTSVSATYVMLFVLFGALVERTGTGKLFMDFALALTGHRVGGPAKVACITSGLFGTVSGSAVANVMTTGAFTIPLMKRLGYRPAFAASVEAVASTGGQIMPPIMGAAAFIMAEFLGVPYLQVAAYALIPALLYYLAVYAAVHFEAQRTGMKGLPREELPGLKETLRDHGHLATPLVVVLVTLFMGYSAAFAALSGVISVIPSALLRASTRKYVRIENIIAGLVDGARNTIMVALACATAGIVIGVISLTGLGLDFTSLVVAVSQDTLLVALIMTMVAGIILGMGMPTSAAYIMQVALLVPALVKLGVPLPAAHLFVLYYAILSAITPPVALAVYAAKGIAGGGLWETSWDSVKLGFTGYIVPFMFVFGPSLLMQGPWHLIALAAASAVVGVLCLAAALAGFFRVPLALWQRAMLAGAAFVLINPGLVTDLIGISLIGVVLVSSRLLRPAEAVAAPDSGS